MANVSIISGCNNNCKYCFQHDSYHQLCKKLTYEEYEDILVWLKGVSKVGILGGEPTLHPDIVKMCDRAYREFETVVFSNLLCKTEILEKILNVAPNIGWLVNTTTRDDLKDLFEENINLFNKRNAQMAAGITLMHDEEYDWRNIENMVRIGKKYPDIVGNYRVGLATPFHKGRVEILCYDETLLKMCEYIKKETPNIYAAFDCPTNQCQVTPKTMGILIDDYGVRGVNLSDSCRPPLDILVDKSVKYCFSVPNDLVPIRSYKGFRNWEECESYLVDFKEKYMSQHGFGCRESKDCHNEICGGICFAMVEYLRAQEREPIYQGQQ